MKIEVKCVEKVGVYKGETALCRVTFHRTSETAGAPPTASLQIGDQPTEFADRFVLGKTYTLTIEDTAAPAS